VSRWEEPAWLRTSNSISDEPDVVYAAFNLAPGPTQFVETEDLTIQVLPFAQANAVNLTLLGSGRDRQHRLYRFNRCGHQQEIQTTNVRRDSFLCDQCEETSRDLPSHIYLIDIKVGEENWLKLGYAKTIDARISHYGLPESAVTEELVTIDFETGRKARTDEAALQKKYRPHRLPVKRMKKFHTKSGSGECYPLKMLDTLKDELNSINEGF